MGSRNQARRIPTLSIQKVRFVDEAFPGFVECEFLDANLLHSAFRFVFAEVVALLSIEQHAFAPAQFA